MANYRELFGVKNQKKINRQDLIDMLNQYKSILNDKTITYLEDLINLKYSVVINTYMKNNQLLKDLNIYQKIALYNIYCITKKFLDNNQIAMKDYIDQVWNNHLLTGYLKHDILLEMNLNENDSIVTIHLYNIMNSQEKNIAELTRLKEKLQYLKHHPSYITMPKISSYITENGEENLIYTMPYQNTIDTLQQKQLENDIIQMNQQIHSQPSLEMEKSSQIQHQAYQSLLQFYHLKEDEMKTIPTDSKVQKVLTYKRNGIQFITKTKYI